jgi:predicted lipoprotein with Yx(FWY)xxD motif
MRRTVAMLFAVVLLAGACASGDDDPGDASAETTPAPTATTPTMTPAPDASEEATAEPTTESPTPEPEDDDADGTVITSGDSQFGEMLFDANDQAIYMFDVERSATPECYDDCAVAWPPVLTDGTPQATGNLDPDLLGTTERSDGSTQVTYNDHPLYYYANEAPGEVKCHNVDLNGGLWYVVQPDGDPAPPG